MSTKETKEVYINVIDFSFSISSVIKDVPITLYPKLLAQVLGVPNNRWCHYVSRDYPSLDGIPSTVEISNNFLMILPWKSMPESIMGL